MRKNSRVEVSPGFFLIIAVLLYRDRSGILELGLLACLLHELGHCVLLLIRGNCVRVFRLTAFGASIESKYPMSYMEEFATAAAGPFVNLIMAVLFARIPGGSAFAGANLALCVFNLMPVWRLDGARMLYSALCSFGSEEISDVVCGCLDFCFTLMFSSIGLVFSIRYGNLTLILMCLWLIIRDADEKMSIFWKKYGNRGCQKEVKGLK